MRIAERIIRKILEKAGGDYYQRYSAVGYYSSRQPILFPSPKTRFAGARRVLYGRMMGVPAIGSIL